MPIVRFHLPASKTDVRAIGTAREHGCSRGRVPSPSCPVHSAWDQLTFLRQHFPDKWQLGRPSADLPLFPAARGTACTKEAMTATIVHTAALLGVEVAAPGGSERVSGHSLRATGAQGLAAAGVDTWAIELLGRWGSDAVRGYIRDARLASAASMARRVADALPLEDLVRRIMEEQAAAVPAVVDIAVPRQMPAAGSPPMDLEVPLAAAVALAQAAARPPPEELKLVANSVSKVVHRVAVGPGDGVASSWIAACGWRFGLALHADVLAVPGPPADYRLACALCSPEVQRARFEALTTASAGQ